MSYGVNVLADSISPDEVRLVTIEATFPRFILAEVNTHRMLSRNSASSRAIPTEKIIERVQKDPFIPETFNKRVKGMGVGAALGNQEACVKAWLHARDKSVQAAHVLVDMDVDKSRVNRLLEPFMWHTAIISATEWDNFFALRCHPAAQPVFQIIAGMMREAIAESTPEQLDYDDFHRPLVTREEIVAWAQDKPVTELSSQAEITPVEFWNMVSCSRCARVSYDKHNDDEPLDSTIKRAERLIESGHLSPFEHVATPLSPEMLEDGAGDIDQIYIGNFRGWVQARKLIPNEANFGALQAA
jgi:thymidylate synthase ThyX